MAVYNGEQYIKSSIDSILNQTFGDFEFIIIDDASTDATAVLIDEYTLADDRVRLMRNPSNLGLTKSLNIGIHKSKGEYIARMDAGDTSEPERFAEQVMFLDKNKDHVLVGAWAYTIDEHSKRIGEMRNATDSDCVKKMLIRHNPIVHSSIMVRKSSLERVGNYDESWKYGQDYELYFRLMNVGKLANIPKYLVSYRLSTNSITRKKNSEQIKLALKARAKAIREGQYSFFSYIYLLVPMLGLILPYRFKEFIKKI